MLWARSARPSRSNLLDESEIGEEIKQHMTMPVEIGARNHLSSPTTSPAHYVSGLGRQRT